MGRSGARPPPKVGIGRIPTRSQYVPNTKLSRVDSNFKDTAQFLTRWSMSITARLSEGKKKGETKETHPEKWDQLCAFQEFGPWICKPSPDLLESPHLLSRDRLCTTRSLIHVRKVLNDKTCIVSVPFLGGVARIMSLTSEHIHENVLILTRF